MDARYGPRLRVVLILAVFTCNNIAAASGFTSVDYRLPNPDRPYEMTSGAVSFSWPPFFELAEFEFEPSDPSQLAVPSLNDQGQLAFDSEFDITYRAMVSFGDGPTHPVEGFGTAHAVGVADAHTNPQVFESELLALDLYGLSPIPEVYLRESPTIASKGVITRTDLCPLCLAPITYWHIASSFEVYAEFSRDGGHTWATGDRPFRIEQAPTPPLTGDYNVNSLVDVADYAAWRDGLGSGYTYLDYLVWQANFGATDSGGSGSTFGAVPEPASAAMLVVAAIAVAGIYSHRPVRP
jgi:hypothetical protein